MFDRYGPLTDEQKRQVQELQDRLRELGSSLDGWQVEEAVQEDNALVAVHLLGRQLWLDSHRWLRKDPEEWWPWKHVQELPHPDDDPEMRFLRPAYALRRVLDGGADPADLKEIVHLVVYETLMDTLRTLGEGRARRSDKDLPGWRLMEVGRDGELTGRRLTDLLNVWVAARPWDHERDDADGDEAESG
jgi:hypothetical protein